MDEVDNKFPASDVGQNTGARRGEDIAKSEAEAGRVNMGTTGAERPAGGTTQRFYTGVDPQDPDDTSPAHAASPEVSKSKTP